MAEARNEDGLLQHKPLQASIQSGYSCIHYQSEILQISIIYSIEIIENVILYIFLPVKES